MLMAWMRMPGQTWPGAAASFLLTWVLMMVARRPDGDPLGLRDHGPTRDGCRDGGHHRRTSRTGRRARRAGHRGRRHWGRVISDRAAWITHRTRLKFLTAAVFTYTVGVVDKPIGLDDGEYTPQHAPGPSILFTLSHRRDFFVTRARKTSPSNLRGG
jgi:hypothetical protein